MSPNSNKTQSAVQGSIRPPVAVELAPEGVLAATLPARGEAAVFAFAPLAPGLLTPGIDGPNLHTPEQVGTAIGAALADIAPRTRDLTLILPDPSVRVFVLDFDTLPAKSTEAVPVIKFRLRKMVPFDVEHAGVSYQVLSQTQSECRVLIAVLPGSILQEYETAVRSAGYEPGAVLPSSLAALAALDTNEPVLAACMSGISLTTAITSGQDLLLYRTLDLPADPAQRLAEVQRDIAVAAAYFEDKLAARPRLLHYTGTHSADDFASWLQVNDPELAVVDLAPRPSMGAASAMGPVSFAAIAGALAGAV